MSGADFICIGIVIGGCLIFLLYEIVILPLLFRKGPFPTIKALRTDEEK